MESPATLLASTIKSLNTEGFAGDLNRWLRTLVNHDNTTILAYFQDQIPLLLMTDAITADVHRHMKNVYLAGAYLLDPFYEIHQSQKEAGMYHIWDIAPDQFIRNQYFIVDDLRGLQKFLADEGRPERLKEGGLAQRIFDEAPAKGFSQAEAAQLMRDYINPSLDTTISVLGFAAYYFAKEPAQWDILRDDPSLIPNAIEEVVRLSTPIRAFSRYCAQDYQIERAVIPKGSRVIIVYASANRDERMFEKPDVFDVTRNVRKHVGFGHGVHMCMGLHLARLEMCSVLASMLKRVTRWELDGEPKLVFNNTIRAFERLPMRIVC